MNKLALIVTGISLGITCLFSTLFGFAGSTIIGTFWGWFWISLLTQFVIFVVEFVAFLPITFVVFLPITLCILILNINSSQKSFNIKNTDIRTRKRLEVGHIL
jgi:hypothetical protein